jgi:uncharacterized membrane protein YozB (DUF420 family)
MISVSDLPHLNATLNAISALLLVTGFLLVKSGRINAHRRAMLGACAASALFLVSYVTYHAQVGSRPFPGTGAIRIVYFSVLIPHVLLAAAILPLAIVTVARGLRRDDTRHRRIARWTLPLWLFVSVTGVIVYVMLYWMY